MSKPLDKIPSNWHVLSYSDMDPFPEVSACLWDGKRLEIFGGYYTDGEWKTWCDSGYYLEGKELYAFLKFIKSEFPEPPALTEVE
jgi:hypothetical protein